MNVSLGFRAGRLGGERKQDGEQRDRHAAETWKEKQPGLTYLRNSIHTREAVRSDAYTILLSKGLTAF